MDSNLKGVTTTASHCGTPRLRLGLPTRTRSPGHRANDRDGGSHAAGGEVRVRVEVELEVELEVRVRHLGSANESVLFPVPARGKANVKVELEMQLEI